VGESLGTPEGVRPRSPQKKGKWMSEVPLSKSVHDSALLKARQRNVLRLKRANEKDSDTLSKYLPSDSIPVTRHLHKIRNTWRTVDGVYQSCSGGTAGLQSTMDPSSGPSHSSGE
jgi:hypothetical protein